MKETSQEEYERLWGWGKEDEMTYDQGTQDAITRLGNSHRSTSKRLDEIEEVQEHLVTTIEKLVDLLEAMGQLMVTREE